jgi:hypothetical protein
MTDMIQALLASSYGLAALAFGSALLTGLLATPLVI